MNHACPDSDEGVVQNKAVYGAIGVTAHGTREVLGLGITHVEGAESWLRVHTELKARGVRDFPIVCVDGLTGFPETIESAPPHGDGADLRRAHDPELAGVRGPQGAETSGG